MTGTHRGLWELREGAKPKLRGSIRRGTATQNSSEDEVGDGEDKEKETGRFLCRVSRGRWGCLARVRSGAEAKEETRNLRAKS